jgi:hypothetical protein
MKIAKDKNIQGESERMRKKRYHSPKLTNFGTVAQITLTHGIGPLNDRGMNTMALS